MIESGTKFGHNTVLMQTRTLPNSMRVYLCKCDCGKTREVPQGNLKTGKSRSCGCKSLEHSRETRLKRDGVIDLGKTFPPEYRIWYGIKTRCYNPKSTEYKYYGGRGIKVCERWRESFGNFLVDMGTRRVGLQIDRINNDGNYEPSNCRWTTRKINMRNSRHFIKDDLSNRDDLSHQRKTQMRWQRQGRCITCGKRAIIDRDRCKKHLEYHRNYQRVKNAK